MDDEIEHVHGWACCCCDAPCCGLGDCIRCRKPVCFFCANRTNEGTICDHCFNETKEEKKP